MMYKKIYFTMAVFLTLGTAVTFFLRSVNTDYVWVGITVLAWLLPLGVQSSAEELEEEEEEIEEERVRQDYHGIPGYEKSGFDIKGCYNCYYSKDIGNETFLLCKKYSQKVYRHNICDSYDS